MEQIIQLHSRAETAEILHISTRTLGRYKKVGLITPKIIGGKDLYTIQEINRFIEKK